MDCEDKVCECSNTKTTTKAIKKNNFDPDIINILAMVKVIDLTAYYFLIRQLPKIGVSLSEPHMISAII